MLEPLPQTAMALLCLPSRKWKAMATFGLFDRLRTTDAAKLRRIIAAVVLTGVGAFAASATLGIKVNATMSEPIGLYIRTADPDAKLVEFCPPEPFAFVSRRRGYRPRGNCPDGAAPLLKSVVARAGDLVEMSALGITVNGKLLPNTSPRALDSAGRKLTPWPFGRYVVQHGTVWTVSTYHPRSFDSRYFGPIRLAAIQSYVRPLIVLR
jgi:conjugative transfer signal peptidase TraF